MGQGEAQATCPVKSPGDPLPAGQGCPWGHKPSLEREQPHAEGLGGGVGGKGAGRQMQMRAGAAFPGKWPFA